MKWSETTASQCRWAEAAELNWGTWDIIWEDSEADYQGHATILATKNGEYVFYEWWYGSCSGCDPWEDEYTSWNPQPGDNGMPELAKHMNEQAAHFKNEAELRNWLDMLEGQNPIGNAGAGGLVGMLDTMGGALRARIDAIRAHLKMPPFDWTRFNKEDK